MTTYYTLVQATDSEISLVRSRYAKNDTSKVLWAIFEIDKLASGKPKVLEYKIRSSEIGENRVHEEEPAHKGIFISRHHSLAFKFNYKYKIILQVNFILRHILHLKIIT